MSCLYAVGMRFTPSHGCSAEDTGLQDLWVKDLIFGAGWPTMASCEAKGYSYSPWAHQLVGISYLIFCKTCSGEHRVGLVPGGWSSTGMGWVSLLGAGRKPSGVYRVGRDLQLCPHLLIWS